jgi:hypothetical protein
MPNTSGNAYGLTTLCPVKNSNDGDQSDASHVREYLQELLLDEDSPMAKVPNTYLARLFILNDTIYESNPHHLDKLKSSYLVFTSNFHGDLDTYLTGMWDTISSEIKDIWSHCVGFDGVNSAASFVAYIKKCQVKTTFFFNGSNDDSLKEQLKSLYLKQEFSDFVFAHQGVSEEQLLEDYKAFVKRTNPEVLEFPTWRAGGSSLKSIVVNENEVS